MRRLLAPYLLALPALLSAGLLAGCGGDDDDGPAGPTDPPPADVLLVPEEFATVAAAVMAADPGDVVSVAAGTFVESVVIEKSLTVRGREPGGATVLEASRLRVLLGEGDRVELLDLTFSDADTLVSGDLEGGSLAISACTISHTVCGILCTGEGSVEISDVVFRDLGLDSGPSSGAVDLAGELSVDLAGCTFTDCRADEPGVVRLGGAVTFDVAGCAFAACAGDQAVVNVVEAASGVITGCAFDDCARYTVRHRGDALELRGSGFTGGVGPAVGVGEGSRLTATDVHVRGCAAPVLETGGRVAWSRGSATASTGDGSWPVLLVGRRGELSLDRLTVDGHAGPFLAVAGASDVAVTRTIVTGVAVPLAVDRRAPGQPAPTLAFSHTDLWAPGEAAWTGLEAERDAGDGNLEADPLYCDAGVGDFRLQAGSPCVADGEAVCGGFGVGCR